MPSLRLSMPSSRLRRLAATALAAVALSTGAVATATPAVARDDYPEFGNYNVIIGNVALAPDKAITVDVTYVCEPTPELYMGVRWRLADGRDSQLNSPRGVATVHGLTCDEQAHVIQVTVPVLDPDSLPFGKGDPVLVETDLNNIEGLPYASTRKVSTL